jgi:hypothetical protein
MTWLLAQRINLEKELSVAPIDFIFHGFGKALSKQGNSTKRLVRHTVPFC